MAGSQSSNQQSQNQSSASSSGGSYFPVDYQSLWNALQGPLQFAAGNYANFLQDPTSSPLYQSQLKGLMASLSPYETQARNSLTDAFRASGGLRSGAYGHSIPQLEGELMGRRQQAAGNLLGQVYQQTTGAFGNLLAQAAPLLNALKLTQQQSQSQSSGFSSGSSQGSSTDPVQPGNQGSGMNARDLLSMLTGMSRPGQTGPTASGTGNYPTYTNPYASGPGLNDTSNPAPNNGYPTYGDWTTQPTYGNDNYDWGTPSNDYGLGDNYDSYV